MTKVAILPIPASHGGITYRAVAGDKRSHGATAGAALDALTAQLPTDEAGTVVVVLHQQPDRFFDAAQQQRLAQLMLQWRAARAQGQSLAADVQAALDTLVEAELQAATARAASLADELQQ